MEIIDTHCHLDVDEFDPDRDEVLKHCRENHINKIIVPSIDANGWHKLLELCKHEKGLYPALGLHPVYIYQHKDDDLDKLDELIKRVRPVAVGEIGLDFYIKETDKERQVEVFEKQLVIAKNNDLPVLLHVRKAHDQVLQLLKKHRVKGGFSHAFNGSQEQAQQYIDLGFKLGFGGTLTYSNANKIHQLAKSLPLESIVLETDAPDMVVESHRGERNSPEYIHEALIALARLRQLDVDVVAEQTTVNANEIINFKEYEQQL